MLKKRMREKRDLTEGNIVKNIWYLALPTMVTSALQDLFNIVDMIYVGKLGPSSIASVAMSGIIIGVVNTVTIGIATGTVALISRFFGAKDYDTANNIVIQTILLAVIASVVIGVTGYFFALPLMHLLGAKGDVLDLGTIYLKIMAIGSFTMFLVFSLNAILRGAGDPVTPMKVLVFSTVLNIILDPLLIFGIWFFPKMGVAGSSLATVIARGVGMFILLIIFMKGHSYFHLKLHDFRLDIRMMWRIIKIGFFSSLQALLRNISALILMRVVAFFGTFAVAAYGIGMRIRMATMMPGFGFSQASAVLVGQNLGAKKPKRATRSAWLTVGLYEILIVFLSTLIFVLAPFIVKTFNTNPEVVRIATQYLRIFSLTLVFLALSIVIGRSFNGAGDTVSPMVITGICLLLFRIPLAILLAKIMSTTGIWLALGISDVVQGITMSGWFLRGKWKDKKV